MYAYEVGKPYDPSRLSRHEGSQYNYRGGEHELAIFTPGPTRDEIEAARTGEAEFALHVVPPLLVLRYRFGSGAIPWSDAPYSYHLVPEYERIPPPASERAHDRTSGRSPTPR